MFALTLAFGEDFIWTFGVNFLRDVSIKSNTMEKRCRALLLDKDSDTLITLQHAFEHVGIDATVTRGEMEAWGLIETAPFDLILVGDHPPELNAAAILDDRSLRGICPPVLILRGIFGEKDAAYFLGLGAVDVVPKGDARVVLEHVARALAWVQLKTNADLTGAAHRNPPPETSSAASRDPGVLAIQ